MTEAKIEPKNVFGTLMSPDVLRDPYPYYAELRAAEPVLVSPGPPALVFTRHASVSAILQDKRFSNSWPSAYRFARPLDDEEQHVFSRIIDFFTIWMQANDAPRHSRIRGLVQRAFTARMIDRMQPLVDAIVRSLIEPFRARGAIDLMADFAQPLPAFVIAEMFGLPASSRAEFIRSSSAIVTFVGIANPAPGQLARIESEIASLRGYLGPIIDARRTQPGSDLISALLQPDDSGDVLTTDEIVVQCTLMLAAGHETTTNLIGSGFLALLRHPEQMKRLQGDPSLIKGAIEELLRFEAPVQWMPRLAGEDFTFQGAPLAKGQLVWLGLAAASRDPDQFEKPDELDVGRKGIKTLSFGGGPHFCLGAALARMEGQAAFQLLLTELEGVELAVESVDFVPNFTVRGLASLPLRFRAAA